jgi:predicted nucleic acid-binding Zn ribbon protein
MKPRAHVLCPVCGVGIDRVFLRQHVGSVRCRELAGQHAPRPNAAAILEAVEQLDRLLGLGNKP